MEKLWKQIWYKNSQERDSTQRVIIRRAVNTIIDAIHDQKIHDQNDDEKNREYILRIGFVNSDNPDAGIQNNNFQNDNARGQKFEESLGDKTCYLVRIVVNGNQSDNWEIFSIFEKRVKNKQWNKNIFQKLNNILKDITTIINFEIYSIRKEGFEELYIDDNINEPTNMFNKLKDTNTTHPSFQMQKVIDGIKGGINRNVIDNPKKYKIVYLYPNPKREDN